jgi:hypothetical protein
MPNKLEAVLPSDAVRVHTRAYRRRLASLCEQHASLGDLRLLQFTIVKEYLKGQRYFVALHGKLLSELRADNQLQFLERQEALKLFSALSELYELMRSINAHIADVESHDAELADGNAACARTNGPTHRH